MASRESEFKTLTEVGMIGRGKSKHRPRNDPDLYGGDYPFVQTGDVKHAPFYLTEFTQTYNEKGLAQSKLWPSGTLCITIAANIADTAILGIPACFPDSILGFTPKQEKADVRYVKYCLDAFRAHMEQISKGTTQDNLSMDKLLKLKFWFPDIDIQQKIAGVLTTYDDLIANNQRRIALLESMAEEIYREWFVRMRFPTVRDKKVEDLDQWNLLPLEDLGTFLNGYAFDPSEWYSEGLPIIKIKELNSGISTDTPRNSGDTVPAKYHFNDGDIVFSWSGSLIVQIWHQGEALLNQHLFKVTPVEGIPRDFLYLTIKFAIPVFESLTTGATMQHIKRKELRFVKVSVPPREIMKSFKRLVEPIMDQALNLKQISMRLVAQRDSLLPRLISGKLRVDQLDIEYPPSMKAELEQAA